LGQALGRPLRINLFDTRANDVSILNMKPKMVETYLHPILWILRIVRVQFISPSDK
jgi:hypothetical protein